MRFGPLDELEAGVEVGRYRLRALRRPGRSSRERRLRVLISDGWSEDYLLSMLAFEGIGHYRPWIEVYAVNPNPAPLTPSGYHGSTVERFVIHLLGECAEGGEHVFVSYSTDEETVRLLESGLSPFLTRPGFLLFKEGFTWFKDWYYAEGMWEGEVKLQAEKPVDERMRRRHLTSICRQIEDLKRELTSEISPGVEERLRHLRDLCQGLGKRKITDQRCEAGCGDGNS